MRRGKQKEAERWGTEDADRSTMLLPGLWEWCVRITCTETGVAETGMVAHLLSVTTRTGMC